MPYKPFSSERAAIASGQTRGLLDRAEHVLTPRSYDSRMSKHRRIRSLVELISLQRIQETRIELLKNKLLVHTRFLRTQQEEFGLRAIALAGTDPGRTQTEPHLYLAPVHSEGTSSGDIFLMVDPPQRRNDQPSSELIVNLQISNWPIEELDDTTLLGVLERSLQASQNGLEYSPHNALTGWVKLTFDPRLPQAARELVEKNIRPANWNWRPEPERLAAILASRPPRFH